MARGKPICKAGPIKTLSSLVWGEKAVYRPKRGDRLQNIRHSKAGMMHFADLTHSRTGNSAYVHCHKFPHQHPRSRLRKASNTNADAQVHNQYDGTLETYCCKQVACKDSVASLCQSLQTTCGHAYADALLLALRPAITRSCMSNTAFGTYHDQKHHAWISCSASYNIYIS